MTRLRQLRSVRVALVSMLVVLGLSGGSSFAADVTTPFAGKAVNGGTVTVFRTKSGYAGVDVGEYGQPGSNGLSLDREGRLTITSMGIAVSLASRGRER